MCGVPSIGPSQGILTSPFYGKVCLSVIVWECYPPPKKIFHEHGSVLAPITTGSPMLPVMVLQRLLRRVQSPVTGSFRNLQTTLACLHEFELRLGPQSVAPECRSSGFDSLTLRVEHTVKTKVVALRQLLQWSGHPAVVLL